MNNKFDELAKGLAQSVTRRQALKKFGVGLAGMALACLGLPGRARAATGSCQSTLDCGGHEACCSGTCVPLNTNSNCGACGNVCVYPRTCKNVSLKGPGGEFHVINCV